MSENVKVRSDDSSLFISLENKVLPHRPQPEFPILRAHGSHLRRSSSPASTVQQVRAAPKAIARETEEVEQARDDGIGC
jgi:hypothetical protein